MTILRFYICLFLTVCSAYADDHISPFDFAVQEITHQEHVAQPEQPTESHTPQKKESHLLDYESCQKAIDFMALASAFVRVYGRYQRIYGPPTEMDWWEKAWDKVCPELIQDAGQHSKLFKETVEIVFETVTLKTVAHLILFCWKGDAVSMAKATAARIRRFFSLLA